MGFLENLRKPKKREVPKSPLLVVERDNRERKRDAKKHTDKLYAFILS